jgi:hypothetical protein
VLQPTIRSTLSCVNPTDYLICTALAILQPTVFRTLPADITTDYPTLYSIWCYSNRLSNLPTIRSAALLQPTMLCDLLYLAILQPTLRSLLFLLIRQPTIRRSTLSVDITSDNPLCSLWRYSNQLFNILTIRSAISCVTPTEYAVCSTLPTDTTTDSPLCNGYRYSNRLSAALLCLSILQLTIRSTLSGATSTDYPIYRLSLCCLLRCSNQLCCVLYSTLSSYPTTDSPLCFACRHYN